MLTQTSGKIFLSSERGHTETEWFRSYNTFNFGNFQNKNKQAFGPLYVLNDDTLAGGKSIQLSVEEDSDILLLPTVGAIHYKDSIGNENFLHAGQVKIFSAAKGTTINIANPYQEDLINFLQLWFKAVVPSSSIPGVTAFDIEVNKNNLIDLFPIHQTHFNQNFKRACVGKFSGRSEITYKPASRDNGIFVFVLQGAFEVQYRLMETRDGLALWSVDEIELEALSNEAIILLTEMEMNSEMD